MNWFRKDRWRTNAAHADVAELLQFLDGELSARRTSELTRHLESCWECRQRKTELESTIGAFMSVRQDELAAPIESLSRSWPSFWARARRLEPARTTPRIAFRWAAAVACLLVALLTWRLVVTEPVSAKELLLDSRTAEQKVTATKSRAVVRQTLRVTRKGRTGTVDLYHDRRSGRLAAPAPASDNVWSDVERILASNGIRDVQPLSTAAIDAWRANTNIVRDEVQRVTLATGERAFQLRTVAAPDSRPDRIIESETLFRESDLHPLEQNLTLAGDNNPVRLVETRFEVLEFAALPAALFGDPLPTGLPSETAVATSKPTPTDNSAPRPALEVEVLLALHGARACGGEIAVTQVPDGSIAVNGIVESTARRSEIIAALPRSPKLQVNLRTATSTAQPTEQLEIQDLSSGTESSPFEQLRKDLKAPEALAISGQALVLSQAALNEAWELRRLAERFPQDRLEALTPDSAAGIGNMVSDHDRKLQAHLADLRRLMAKALPNLSAAQLSSSPERTWQQRAIAVQNAASTLNERSRALFTSGPSTDPSTASAALANALLTLEREALR